MNRTLERVDEVELIEDEAGLWEEILDVVDDGVPRMPTALASFDRIMTNKDSAAETEAVFMIWLKQRLSSTPEYINPDAAVPCQNPREVEEYFADPFFPEWPDENDFRKRDDEGKVIDTEEDVSRNPTYRRLSAEANIDTARAKSECFECPIRIQCLARSLRADADYGVLEATDEESEEGVFGGWGKRARQTVAAAFHIKRRAYEKGVKEEAAGVPIDLRKGMPLWEIESLERQAREQLVASGVLTN